jgi:hypothetical protein
MALDTADSLNHLAIFASLPGEDSAPVLFNGPFSDPTFTRGTFRFDAFAGNAFQAARDGGTVQIPAVPEPATWLSMIGGFGLAGGLLRYRRRMAAARPAGHTAATVRQAGQRVGPGNSRHVSITAAGNDAVSGDQPPDQR